MERDLLRKILWGVLACGVIAGLAVVPGLTLTLALGYGIYRGVKVLRRIIEPYPRLREVLRGLGFCLAAVFALAAPGLALLAALAAAAVRGAKALLEKKKAAGAPDASARVQGPEGGEPAPFPEAEGGGASGSAGSPPPVEPSRGGAILKGMLMCLAAAGGVFLVKLLAVSLILAAGLALLFSSCVDHGRPHSRREVLAYVREEFPGQEVVVSKQFSNPQDEEGAKAQNRTWECYFADLPEMTFTIGSYYWNGGPVPVWGYSLSDTAQSAARSYYLEKYLDGVGSLDLWETDEWRFEMEFSSMAEVRAALKQLEDYTGWYALQPHSGTPPGALGTLTGLRLPPEALFRDSTLYGDEDADLEELCGDILKNYYTFYNLPCPDFSEEEVQACARRTWEWSGFVPKDWKTGEWMSQKDFQDVRLERGCVSFGGLYTVLERVGAAPEGTPEAWAVTGADGCRYEFSYDFQAPENGEIVWYYLKDGRRMPAGKNEPDAPVLLWEGDEVWAMLIHRNREEPPEETEAPLLELKPAPAA